MLRRLILIDLRASKTFQLMMMVVLVLVMVMVMVVEVVIGGGVLW